MDQNSKVSLFKNKSIKIDVFKIYKLARSFVRDRYLDPLNYVKMNKNWE